MSDGAREADVLMRAVQPEEDIPRLADLLAAVEAADGTGEDTSEEAIRETMAWPGHDPRRDRWVIETPGEPGRLIAHSLVWKGTRDTHAEMAVAVHPAWRRRGLGGALLGRALGRARAVGVTAVRAYANEGHPAATPFLRRYGFTPVAAYTEMRFPADRAPAPPVFPDAYRVRTYDDVGDSALLARAMTDAYSGLWGHHAVSAQDLAHWLPAWRPDGIFLLFDERAEVVGLCRAEVREMSPVERPDKPAGYVDAPGVVAARRGDDLFVPLLLTGMHWLRAHGIGAIGLESWGDDEGTLQQYRALGFTVARRAISHHLKL